MKRTVLTLAALAASTALLTGCGTITFSTGDSEEQTQEPAEEQPAAEDPAADASPAESEEPAGSGGDTSAGETPVNQSHTDVGMGHEIEVLSARRGFEPTAADQAAPDGGEWILVKIRTVSGDKFYGGVGSHFKIAGATDGVDSSELTTLIEDDLSAQGLPMWSSTTSGETSEGWLAFKVWDADSRYTFRYDRPAGTNTTDNTSVPADRWEVGLF